MARRAKIRSFVRGKAASFLKEGIIEQSWAVQINTRGDLLAAQCLPARAELVRMGESWSVTSKQVGASSSLSGAFPSVVAGFSLWNGEYDGGSCYVIDSFGLVEIASDATEQDSVALYAMNNIGKQPRPSTGIGPTAMDLRIALVGSGNATLGGSSQLSGGYIGYTGRGWIGVALGVTDDGWCPYGPSEYSATAFAGGIWRVHEANVSGRYIVQPGGLFNIYASKVNGLNTTNVSFFIRWHELHLPLNP